MREAYEENIRKTSTENLKKRFPDRQWIEDAQSTWVSRKDLEQLLDANNADGLRIYYGCHFQKTNDDPKLDQHGLHNLIFVATKDSGTSNFPSTETSLDQLWDDNITGDEPNGYEGAAADATQLCPPYCPPPPPPQF